MGLRLNLQSLLEEILETKYVYFQPPETIKMHYPCIIYKRSSGGTRFADDKPYKHKMQYQLIIVDKDPDSLIPAKIAELPMCIFDRHYTADNLNHDVYNIYY